MKWKPDKNMLRWGVTVFLTAAAVLLFYYFLFHGSRIGATLYSLSKSLMAVIYGMVIAYVLSPVLHFVEKRFFASHYRKKGIDLHAPENEKIKKRVHRISIAITMILFLIILVLLLAVVIPQLIKNVQSIVVSFPVYVSNVTKLTNTYLADHPDVAAQINTYLKEASAWITGFVNNTVIPQATVIIRQLSKSVVAFVMGVFNFVIGVIVAVYLLNGKDHLKAQAKKIIYAFFKPHMANELISGARFAHYTFSGFIVGKLVDSVIVFVICYIGARLLGTPYPMLMSVIVGVTNIIPFFGPYIGEFVTFFLLLLIDPLSGLIFLLFVFVLQQFDGNILGPKILGNATGLSSFWVIFSVLLFGNLFGVIGWILGVPIFAILYALLRRVADQLLEKKGLPTETEPYADVAYVHKGEPVMKADADWDLYHVRHPQSIWKRIFSIRRKVETRISEVVHPSHQAPESGQEEAILTDRNPGAEGRSGTEGSVGQKPRTVEYTGKTGGLGTRETADSPVDGG